MMKGQQGRYIRQRRKAHGKSLREVAEAIDLSFVYLGEVERAVRGPLLPRHWGALIRVLPSVDPLVLQQLAFAEAREIAAVKYAVPENLLQYIPKDVPKYVPEGEEGEDESCDSGD